MAEPSPFRVSTATGAGGHFAPPVTAIDRRTEIIDGLHASIPVVVSSAPFGLLFGAVATHQGLSVGEATLMSAAIYGGASQMVGMELFGQHISPALIVFSIFAVNFRHVLYSATLGRRLTYWPAWKKALGFFFLVDPQFAEGERRSETQRVTLLWFMMMALPIYVCWVAEAAIGARFGDLVPDPHAIGLDFLLPIYFFGIVMSFRKRPLWLPVVGVSAVASIVAANTIGSPWHVSIGALAGLVFAFFAAPVKREGAL